MICKYLDQVTVAGLNGNISGKVIKKGIAVPEFRIIKPFQYPVRIGGTGAQYKRGMIFFDGSFNCKVAGNGTDAPPGCESIPVAIPGADIKIRSKPASIFSRYIAFIQPEILYYIRTERREESKQMRGIVYRYLIDIEKVLISRTTPYIEAG